MKWRNVFIISTHAVEMLKGLTGSSVIVHRSLSVTVIQSFGFQKKKHEVRINMNIVIRNEIKSDIKAISEITKAAFETLPISGHTEQFIIDALRDANALTISLVAVAGNKL